MYSYERSFMEIVLFVAPVVLYVIAIRLATGKANNLIQGFNTATDAEKAKTNEKALAKFMSLILFVLATIQLMFPICYLAKVNNFRLISLCLNIASICVIVVGVVYVKKGKRFTNS